MMNLLYLLQMIPGGEMDNESITKTEFYSEINKLVTKEEFQAKLKKLATKDDLKKFATKENLHQSDKYIETLIKRNETEIKKLNEKFDLLSSLILQNTARLDLMETKEEANEKFNQMMSRLDYIVGILKDNKIETAALDHGLTRMEKDVIQEKVRNDKQDEKLIDHEGRILKLEKQVAV